MAGLAEVAFWEALMINWLVLFIVGVLLVFGWVRRSWRFGAAALIAVVLLGWWACPWGELLPSTQPAYILNDPDYVYWRSRFQVMGVAWITSLLLGITLLALIRKFPKERRQTKPEPHPLVTSI